MVVGRERSGVGGGARLRRSVAHDPSAARRRLQRVAAGTPGVVHCVVSSARSALVEVALGIRPVIAVFKVGCTTVGDAVKAAGRADVGVYTHVAVLCLEIHRRRRFGPSCATGVNGTTVFDRSQGGHHIS